MSGGTPTDSPVYTLDRLVVEERSIDFDCFDHADAWALGSRIYRSAVERDLAITAAIWLGEQRVFHVGMSGTSADNDQWMERKAALVRRYDAASWLTTHRFRSHGIVDESQHFGLDPAIHSLSGGGLPIRIHGTTVGVVVVSGIDDDTDHALAVEALRAHRNTI